MIQLTLVILLCSDTFNSQKITCLSSINKTFHAYRMWFCGNYYPQPSLTYKTHCNKIKSLFWNILIFTETTAWEATQQSLSTLALSGAVRVNRGHTGSVVKCSCSSLTVHTALCIVFVGVPRSWECLADVGGRKRSAHIWERWLMLGPSGSAAPALSNPGALASSPGARRSNTWHRTVKTHLVMERRTGWEAVIQFTSKKEGQKSTLLWLLGPMCSLSSFLCLTCISPCL